jgi:hypothetical protein
MPYVPNAADPSQPTLDKTVLSAAEEFRALKAYIQGVLASGTSSVALAAALAATGVAAQGNQLVYGTGRCIDSIAVLKTLPKTGQPHAFVFGYYVPGDGGGGAYYYDAADIVSADNGGTIIVAADGGRWKLLSPTRVTAKQFGAKG